MKWKQPPIIKIYEALGSLGDGRVVVEENQATVYSSRRDKHYEVRYDPEENAITANDNGSFWQKYLGYPSIVFLLQKDILKHDKKWEIALKDIAWKDINAKFKNDFNQSEEFVRQEVVKRGYSLDELDQELASIASQITALDLEQLRPGSRPPK